MTTLTWEQFSLIWSMEEFTPLTATTIRASSESCDTQTGPVYTQRGAPSPKREFARNNYGDVWVVATVKGIGKTVKINGEELFDCHCPEVRQFGPARGGASAAGGQITGPCLPEEEI